MCIITLADGHMLNYFEVSACVCYTAVRCFQIQNTNMKMLFQKIGEVTSPIYYSTEINPLSLLYIASIFEPE